MRKKITKKQFDHYFDTYGMLWAFNYVKLSSGKKQPAVIHDYSDIDELMEEFIIDYKREDPMFTPYYSMYKKAEEEVRKREAIELLREKNKAASEKVEAKEEEKKEQEKPKETIDDFSTRLMRLFGL